MRSPWCGPPCGRSAPVLGTNLPLSQALPPAEYADLRALVVNCTQKPSPQRSPTELLQVPVEILEIQGVTVESVRAVDLDLAPGVQPGMTEHGFECDDWPALYEKVQAADVLIVGTPIELGEKSRR